MECVPNFSEGVNLDTIQAICREIESVTGVSLLNVDPGKATNRTVVTFAGSPEAVVDAAFLAIKKASELIDMRLHSGEHPRMGATDVCPFIPVSGVSMEDAISCAQSLAQRVGSELNIPVFLYEEAQSNKSRSNLSVIRSGEYEGMEHKLSLPEWKPDYGPQAFNAKSGVTAIGARDFLIAYNINLNTASTRIANRIAFDVREAGRVKRDGNPYSGSVVLDEQGEPVRIPGKLKHVKAIGWYIQEYGVAQISMNLTQFRETPVHVAFDAVCDSALSRGVRVTGSELVGLIPLKALTDAGVYFLKKQGRSTGVSDQTLIHIAVKSLGLDELGPFDPYEKIIEYKIQKPDHKALIANTVEGFVNDTASDTPAPGGGSVAALAAALGAALGSMVANLSADKRGWEDRTPYFSDKAYELRSLINDFLFWIDEDTRSFNQVMDAFRLPKSTEHEQQVRANQIQVASIYATEVPLKVLNSAAKVLPLLESMIQEGNPNSLSDAGVGVACIQTALIGARMNVLINAASLNDKKRADDFKQEANRVFMEAQAKANALLKVVDQKLDAD